MSHFHQAHTTDSRKKLSFVLALICAVMLLEFIVGWWSGSLALLADAGHMLSDAAALSMALFALWFARRPSPPHQTYGYYRAEILAALGNALLLTLVLFFIVREAIRRLGNPESVEAIPVVIVGILGLSVNLLAARLLHADSNHSLNVKGAYLEVFADALASCGVIVAALLQMGFGWVRADPLLSLLIALFILPRIGMLLRDVTDVLMESAPRDLDLDILRRTMVDHEGVLDIHDLHVWTITSGRVCMSAHVVADSGADRDQVISGLNRLLAGHFGLAHTTLQVEGANPSSSPSDEMNLASGCDPCP